MATTINQKPNRNIRSLGAPVRGSKGSLVMTSKLAYPAYLVSDKNPGRCQGWDYVWTITTYNLNTKKTKNYTVKGRTSTVKLEQVAINLNKFKATNGNTYTRSNFYPVRGAWAIRRVAVRVRPFNAKGVGEWASNYRDFVQPRRPSITVKQTTSGTIEYTIKQDEGQDYRENWAMRFQVWVYNSRTKENRLVKDASIYKGSALSYSGSVDIPDRMMLTVDEYERITIKAWARGLWGASETATRIYYVSWPMRPTIGRIDYGDATPDSKVTINVETNYHPSLNRGVEHPITGIRLETLVNKTYKKASDIPADESWTETDIVDDGNCWAMSTMAASVWPSPGHTSWVRIKAWNDLEGYYYLYSTPRRLERLETPASTAEDDAVNIISVTPGENGESAFVLLGWDSDDSTGTELTWSDNEYAWRSAKAPESYPFTWDDGQATVGDVTYAKTANVHVPDLSEGVRYYFRARRYLEGDEATSYGKWSNLMSLVPYAMPTVATLNASPSVARGSALPLSWTYDTNTAQRRWEVITGTTTTATDSAGKERTLIDESKAIVVVANGDGEAGSTVIDASRMATLTSGLDSLALAVRISTGSGVITSDAVTVHVADAPSVALTLPETVTSQPLSFGATATVPASLVVIVTATGTPHDHPDGTRLQPQGDTVWSAALTPEWTEVTDEGTGVTSYTATVSAPEGQALYQSAGYDVLVRATDPRTGLSSEDATGSFEVAYGHVPPIPPDEITVAPYDDIDDTGIRNMGALVYLATDATMAETDVYDVYRLTPDGATLIASDRQQGEYVNDPYAPFGEDVTLAYRVAIRTAEGMEEWRDYEYELTCGLTRIDWSDGYVELPYNLTLNEAWEKDFEARRHLDGTIDGYWNPGSQRTMTITTDLRKAWDADVSEAIRRLANHTGPCLVRTHTGLCFMADVQPSSYSWTYNSSVMPMGFDVTEIELLDDFMAVLPVSEDSEESEG